jgi:CBS domain-containing protein
VLAPVFMIGAALGALEGLVFPAVGPGFWALIGLAAVVGGVMRSPLTGVVFALELTHAWPALLPLLIASSAAYGVSALVLRRSVLTEKIARRGYHLSREYDVDPLEVLFVDEVMHPAPAVLTVADLGRAPASVLVSTVPRPDRSNGDGPVHAPLQRLFPVVDTDLRLVGVVPRQSLCGPAAGIGVVAAGTVLRDPLVVHGDDTLRTVASRFAERGVTSAPVVDRNEPDRLLGLVTVEHLLDGRLRDFAEEHHRERMLTPARWVRRRRRGDG